MIPMPIVEALKYYLYEECDYRLDNPHFDLDYIFTTRVEVEMVKTCMIDYNDVIRINNGIVINFTHQNNIYQLEFIIYNHSPTVGRSGNTDGVSGQSVGDYGNYEACATLVIIAKIIEN